MGEGISFGFDFDWERKWGRRVFFQEMENICFLHVCCVWKKKKGAFFFLRLKSKKKGFFNV